MRNLGSVGAAIAASFILCVGAASAQTTPSAVGYQLPPEPLPALVDAPPTPAVSLSPGGGWLLVMERPNLPPIAELARPELGLAGRRIDPGTNGPSRPGYYTGLRFVDTDSRDERAVSGLPADARIASVDWSPDGAHVAFTMIGERGISLWLAELGSASARRVTAERLNAASGRPCEWLSDSTALVCRYIPLRRGAAPPEPTVPSGPVTQEAIGAKAPNRTYQDLLEDSHDEELFDHYFTSQPAIVPVSGRARTIGKSGMHVRVSPSPDGKLLLVDTVHRPYSYLVPLERFPRRIEVWSRSGKLVKTIADLPLAEDVPSTFNSVTTGPRSVAWRADVAATLVWTEAQDGGDARRQAAVRDRVFMWAHPFSGPPRTLVDLPLRYAGILWGDGDLALVSESWWQTRRTRTYIVHPSQPGAKPSVLFDRSFEDRYADPGSPLLRPTGTGSWVVRTADRGRSLFLVGAGASTKGDRPFLDKLDLRTKKTRRLYRSKAPFYEAPIQILDDAATKLLLSRESPDEPANFHVRDLRRRKEVQLTRFPHPTPQLKGTQKKLVRYKRSDGVMLTGTLYLPRGYSARRDGALPAILWAYPQEFKSKQAAGQVKDSPYRFVRVSPLSSLIWLARGYAVLDNPSMPIVGEGTSEPNDTYVKQLVASAEAAVDELVRRGVADRGRVAIGGHSYGAFTTANLLAHTDLFRAGIARSGAYNRTLTPFGFQSEERTFWEAPETYVAMSPYVHADKIDEPLLLIHGAVDENSGTFPMQSERLFEAVKGLGGTARLVLLPHETHGYRARESVLHMLWETDGWLDRYVAKAKPRTKLEGKPARPSVH